MLRFFVSLKVWIELTSVTQGGQISHAQMGDPNASIPTVEPVIMRPMFGAMNPAKSIAWVSQSSVKSATVDKYGLKKRIEAVKACRTVRKGDMKWNDYRPKMKVDAERYVSAFHSARGPIVTDYADVLV